MVGEHIEVHLHTMFCGDRPVNSGDIQDQNFSGRNFGQPRQARGASQCRAIKCACRPRGYLEAHQVWGHLADKLARYLSSKFCPAPKTGGFLLPRPVPPRPASNPVELLELRMAMVDPPTTQILRKSTRKHRRYKRLNHYGRTDGRTPLTIL